MIYTVGNKQEYDAKLAELAAKGERLMKAGVRAAGRERSRGGACWQSQAEALAWIEAEVQKATESDLPPLEKGQRLDALRALEVYGLEAEWEKHTIQFDGEAFARLVVARPVVKLNAAPGPVLAVIDGSKAPKRAAAWVDGVCKTCGSSTHSCKCEHPTSNEALLSILTTKRQP